MVSRFMKGEKLPTLHILASSKRTDQSFLETYIETKKKNESKTTLIIDEPQWVIRTDKDSPNKFPVAIGNRFLESEVLSPDSTEEQIQQYRDKGYQILMVPMGYYEQFLDDINIALTDAAGISTSNTSRYINGAIWTQCRDNNIKNPFTKEIITVGNNREDLAQYSDFFDLSAVPTKYKSKPLYIHLDMSLSGDKTGIAGTWIIGKKPHEEGIPDSKELYYQLAFSVSIKAPKGYQVSFEKNRQFIYWLRDNGFSIKGVSCDTYQSADLKQQLLSHGIQCDTISVDRVSNKICEPYLVFKNAIYERRIVTYPTKLLSEEIVGLLKDANGKIDHDPSGINSKDQCDAVCGSLYNASQHAEEYAFDFGESLDVITEVSNQSNNLNMKQQINIDFEEEMKRAFDPIRGGGLSPTNGTNQFVQMPDFNKQAQQTTQRSFIADNILIW